MRITDFVKRIESYTPATYTFWAGHNRAMYNAEKSITDTMLLVLPNPYPAKWRDGCFANVTFSLWFGKVYEINQTTQRPQQHEPYSAVEERRNLFDTINDTCAMINTDEYISITEVRPITYYDSPDGQSVNRQVWAEVQITAKVWAKTGFDYSLDFNID